MRLFLVAAGSALTSIFIVCHEGQQQERENAKTHKETESETSQSSNYQPCSVASAGLTLAFAFIQSRQLPAEVQALTYLYGRCAAPFIATLYCWRTTSVLHAALVWIKA